LRLQHFFQQHQHTTFLNKGSFYTEIQEHQSKDSDHSAERLKKRYNAHVFLTSLSPMPNLDLNLIVLLILLACGIFSHNSAVTIAAAVGNKVESLHRQQIGALDLTGIPDLVEGHWIYLNAEQVALAKTRNDLESEGL
jgi:hypothetical protein